MLRSTSMQRDTRMRPLGRTTIVRGIWLPSRPPERTSKRRVSFFASCRSRTATTRASTPSTASAHKKMGWLKKNKNTASTASTSQ